VTANPPSKRPAAGRVAIAAEKPDRRCSMDSASPARFPATTPDETPLSGGGRQITAARLEEAVATLREAQR
jgi:hypothetical protein